jgi:molybdopterin converting factor small subunit
MLAMNSDPTPDADIPKVTVELYGVPRLRARTGRLLLEAATVGEALAGLARQCPALEGSVIRGSGVLPSFRLNLNGDRFVTDPETPLADGDALLLMAADAGG